MNNKGFTLVELLATLVILGIVAGIGTYSIIGIVNSSKVNDCKNLKKNIEDAYNEYYQECKYSYTDAIKDICNAGNPSEKDSITIKNLVDYGYLTSNSENKDGKVFNPFNGEDITNLSASSSFGCGE